MNETMRFQQDLPIRGSYDVIVAGGGVAGCAAAFSAALRWMVATAVSTASGVAGVTTAHSAAPEVMAGPAAFSSFCVSE